MRPPREFLAVARQIQREMVNDRRRLHRHPEVGNQLDKTVRYVAARLGAMGVTIREGFPAGLVATIGGKQKGPAILLRADMDALPIREQSGLPFAATNGNAHACGHDLHTAMLLGAARILKGYENQLPGTVILAFQPDEEGMTGAASMIDAGLLDRPRVEAAIGMHVLAGHQEQGVLFVSEGPVMASSDRFRIRLRGRGGHGASPQDTIDPIQAGVHVHLALQGIVARENDPQNPLVITVGTFQAGSTANVIPEEAELTGTVRTLDTRVCHFARTRVEEIAQTTASAFRCTCEVIWESAVPALVNDPALTERVRKWITPVAREVCTMPPVMGSEDFAWIARQVPSVFMFLSAGEPDAQGQVYPGHHPRVRFSENALSYGAAVMASCAANWLAESGS